MKRSIAARITLVLTGLISLAVTVTALLTYFVYLHMEQKIIKDLIQTEADRLVVRVERFGGGPWETPFERDMGPSMYAWGESDSVRASDMPDALRSLPIGLHALDRGDSMWHVAVVNARDGRLYVLYDTVVVEQQMRTFSHALIGIVLACSLLAMLISSTVARWVTTPLNELAERLTRWAPRAPMEGISQANEADRLMEAFNRVQAEVDASIADQRELSANLHHEIRTPLTVIRSDAEIMLMSQQPDAGVLTPRLQRIVRSVHEIDQSLESAFNLAYARFEDQTRVSMRDCVQDMIESLTLEADKAGLTLLNAVDPSHAETLSHHALMTVMRNIMRNAVLHASPATLTIASAPQGLHFTDTGSGIAATELPHVFERYFTHRRADLQAPHTHTPPVGGVNRIGLGLAIAKRVCVMQGWRLDVESPVSNGRGTRFILTFGHDQPPAA